VPHRRQLGPGTFAAIASTSPTCASDVTRRTPRRTRATRSAKNSLYAALVMVVGVTFAVSLVQVVKPSAPGWVVVIVAGRLPIPSLGAALSQRWGHSVHLMSQG
jgi:hypothetical protein